MLTSEEVCLRGTGPSWPMPADRPGWCRGRAGSAFPRSSPWNGSWNGGLSNPSSTGASRAITCAIGAANLAHTAPRAVLLVISWSGVISHWRLIISKRRFGKMPELLLFLIVRGPGPRRHWRVNIPLADLTLGVEVTVGGAYRHPIYPGTMRAPEVSGQISHGLRN
jgi:hypothetical protein